MKEIKIPFSELKDISTNIINIVGKSTGYSKTEISLRTSINYDLGIDGDDWDDILMALHKTQNICLDGFNFYDYFNDETQISNNLIVDSFFLLPRIFLYIFTFQWKYKPFNQFATLNGPLKSPLTIGDLVTSTIEGRFVKRNERRFVLG